MNTLQVFVSYKEAQKLIPIFQTAKVSAKYEEEKRSASRILEALKLVRSDVDYGVLGGKQIFLDKTDHAFLLDVMEQVNI